MDESADYHICTVGRLEKIYIKTMLAGVAEFCEKHKDKRVQLIFVRWTGTEPKKLEKNLRNIENVSNLNIFISGFLYPVPRSIFKYMDAAIATAGSVLTCSDEGVTTISMNVVSGEPIGIYNYNTMEDSYSNENNRFTLCGLLEKILIEKVHQETIKNHTNIENNCNLEFEKHLEFINSSSNEKKYYDTAEICESKIKKIIFRIFKLKII